MHSLCGACFLVWVCTTLVFRQILQDGLTKAGKGLDYLQYIMIYLIYPVCEELLLLLYTAGSGSVPMHATGGVASRGSPSTSGRITEDPQSRNSIRHPTNTRFFTKMVSRVRYDARSHGLGMSDENTARGIGEGLSVPMAGWP